MCFAGFKKIQYKRLTQRFDSTSNKITLTLSHLSSCDVTDNQLICDISSLIQKDNLGFWPFDIPNLLLATFKKIFILGFCSLFTNNFRLISSMPILLMIVNTHGQNSNLKFPNKIELIHPPTLLTSGFRVKINLTCSVAQRRKLPAMVPASHVGTLSYICCSTFYLAPY